MEPTDAHSASRARRPNLSPLEARLLKCAEAATTSLTELSVSWRSMDSALLFKAIQELADDQGGLAERADRIATSLETTENILGDLRSAVVSLERSLDWQRRQQ